MVVDRSHIEVILAELQFMRDLPRYVLFFGRRNRLSFVCSILEEYLKQNDK